MKLYSTLPFVIIFLITMIPALIPEGTETQEQSDLGMRVFFYNQYIKINDDVHLNKIPFIRPTTGKYTSKFGIRNCPFSHKLIMHQGLDIANRSGTIVKATADGIVEFSGRKRKSGKMIILNHGNHIRTKYGHLSRYYVKKGQKVKQGQKIGRIGSTGHSTGPHLHYELHVKGIPTDPYYYIKIKKSTKPDIIPK